MKTSSESSSVSTQLLSGLLEPTVDFSQGLVLAHVKAIEADGRVRLQLPGGSGRSAFAAGRLCRLSSLAPDGRVAVMFLQGDPSLPLILGPIQVDEDQPAAEPPLVVDQIKLEARDQVTLRCGKASIQLQKDGSVHIRGAYVLSRASGTNRIRGGNVQIN